MPQTTYDLTASVKAVNDLLQEGEPENISVDTYSKHSGYKPQHIIDAMNEVFGYGNWGFDEVYHDVLGAEKPTLAISQVRVYLKDCAFQPTGWGQARVTTGDIGDAKKGAQTDALKKTLSYFSIGNRAYLGLLAMPAQEGQNNQGNRVKNQNVPRRAAPEQVTPSQQNNHAPQEDGPATSQQLASLSKLAERLHVTGYKPPQTFYEAKTLLGELSKQYNDQQRAMAR